MVYFGKPLHIFKTFKLSICYWEWNTNRYSFTDYAKKKSNAEITDILG